MDDTHDAANGTTTVLIVGGGLTGLALANELRRLKIPFLLLEANQRLGGRAHSYAHAPPGRHSSMWEHGAQYIGRGQPTIWGLVEKWGLPLVDVSAEARRHGLTHHIMVIDTKRYAYDRLDCLFNIGGLPPDIPLFDLLGGLLLLFELLELETAVDMLEPHMSSPDVVALDEMTMKEWIERPWVPAGARSLITVAVQAVLSVEPADISALYFFWYLACNGGFLHATNDQEGGPQQYFLKDGVAGIVQRLAEPVKQWIRYGEPVQTVDVEATGVTVRTRSGGTHRAKHVVLAMSLHTAGKISVLPVLSGAHRKLVEQKMGRTIKCQLFYEKAWWRDSHGVRYTGYSGASDSPVTWVMDNSTDDAPCLMTFTIGSFADTLRPCPDEVVKRIVAGDVAFLFNDARALDLKETGCFRSYMWDASAQWCGGGPNTIFGKGVLTSAATALNTPFRERLWFACGETSRFLGTQATSRYLNAGHAGPRQSLGYMDGALNEGAFVANQIGKALNSALYDRRVDWDPGKGGAPHLKLLGAALEVSPEDACAILKSFVVRLAAIEVETRAGTTDSKRLLKLVSEALECSVRGVLGDDPQAEHVLGFIQAASTVVSGPERGGLAEEIRRHSKVASAFIALASSECKPVPVTAAELLACMEGAVLGGQPTNSQRA